MESTYRKPNISQEKIDRMIELSKDGKNRSLTEIARIVGCDPKTVKDRLARNGIFLEKSKRVSREKIDQIIELSKKQCYTRTQIANMVRCSVPTVTYYQERAGIEPFIVRRHSVPLTEERKNLIMKALEAGATYKDVQANFAIGRSTISQIKHEMENRIELDPEPNYIVTVELSDEGGTHFIKEIRVHAEYRNDAIKAATEELRQTGYGSYWKLFKSVVELPSTHEDEPVVEEVEPKSEKTERMTEEKKPMSRKAPSVVITKRTIELTGSHTGIGWTLTIQDGKIKMAADRAVEIALDDVAGFTEEMLELLSMVDNG